MTITSHVGVGSSGLRDKMALARSSARTDSAVWNIQRHGAMGNVADRVTELHVLLRTSHELLFIRMM